MRQVAYCERLEAYGAGEPPRIGEIDRIVSFPLGFNKGDIWDLPGSAKWRVLDIFEEDA